METQVNQVFDYSVRQKGIIYCGIPALWIFSIGLGLFVISRSLGLGIFFISAGVVFLVGNTFSALMFSAIMVTDYEISACFLGRKIRSLPWANVTKIVKVRTWNPGSLAHEYVFYTFDSSPVRRGRLPNVTGPIVFTAKISAVKNLIGEINKIARINSIPMFFRDEGIESGRTSEQERRITMLEI